ncbi:S41 family peptidase [Shewanella sp. NIFS-20-20]|uniref:S41 family peptidase n=1 Tax=Shewanella sp. NIFS-20-20 TaxID=2853806 RepID=UPI001C469394|nr:S41 family peptidase [Shewanella sp. NIFS-20-20]MBV7315360.1 PDZ domain-containing protein [Shewanella sp. NIFS-20-20]
MNYRPLYLACSLLMATPLMSFATSSGYYRMPDVHNDQLVFTAEGDIWTKAPAQTQATRLTTQAALEAHPHLSPDGQQLAFVANYDGAKEVYVMPVSGGVPQRVTFEDHRVRLQGWTPEGEILYATDKTIGPSSRWVLKTVSPTSLISRDIPLADAIEGTVDSEGKQLFFIRFGLQASGDNAQVYRGGAKGEIWQYQLGSSTEATRLLSEHSGSIRQPMVWQQALYFISDASGMDNLWRLDLSDYQVTQVTEYTDFPIRQANLNQGQLVWARGADIESYDLASQDLQRLDIQLQSDFTHKQVNRITDPLAYLSHVSFAADGRQAVVTARGKVALVGEQGRRLVSISTPDDARMSQAILSPDGQWVYAIGMRDGRQQIWQLAADGRQEHQVLTEKGEALRTSLAISPDGRYLVHDDYQGNIWLLSIKGKSNSLIVSGGEGLGPHQDIVWSADSRFLAITQSKLGQQRPQILLYSLVDQRSEYLTTDKYESYSPRFSGDGQWLYFLSNREFTSTPTSPWGDRNMGPAFDRRSQIFAIALDKDAPFAFAPRTELSPEPSEPTASDSSNIKVDWQGLSQRLWQVPLASGNYENLQVTDEGLYVLDRASSAGSTPSLQFIGFDAGKAKATQVADNVDFYALSADKKRMLLQQKGAKPSLLIVAASDTLPSDLAAANLSLAGWQLALDPVAEWQQLFDDAHQLHAQQFYDPNMRGLDWQAVKQKYQPLLARVTDRHELNDLFEQMMAELNSLHSQVRGGDLPKQAHLPKVASLGGQLQQDDAGVFIQTIYGHDAELPDMAPPLAKPGVNAEVGDRIIAINGQAVHSIADASRMLSNQVDQPVLLELERNNKRHPTLVTPVSGGDDAKLRYQDWVVNNRQIVSAHTEGKVGYLHLYAMGSNDINSFAREFYTNFDKQGLIIDVRRNRGGNIDSWIIEKLLRRAWAFWQPTRGTAYVNMQQSFRGHLVVLTDQLTYSDGETFAAGVKSLGLAPLIGKQTAGAGVWLSGRNRLADNGMARVAEFPQYAMDGRWIVEGRGVSPDIEVDNLPHATFIGQDAQLQAALAYLDERIDSAPIPPLQAQPLPDGTEAFDIN